MDDFKVLIKAVLDTTGINGNELSKVQKIAEKYTVNIKTKLDDKQALSQFNEVWSKIVAEANKSSNVKLPLKIDNSVLTKSVAQVNAELAKIDKTVADYTAKISQFKSTNSELLSGLTKPLSDFEKKLEGLKNGTSSINEVINSFKMLQTEASKITANFSRQLSPIDKAVNQIAKGESVIRGLRAENKGLASSSKEVNSELNKCTSLLQNVKKIESQEGRTVNWSSAYRQYADAIDNVKAKLSALKKEQASSSNTQIFKIQDLKDNKIAYMSKVYNTIEKQMERINSMAKSQGWSIVDISGIEKADGKISSLTLKIRDAEGALKSLNMQRAQLQGDGKAQAGLMQVGDVKVLETASQAQAKLAQETEKANAKLAEQAKLSISDGNISTQIETLSNGYKKLGLSADEVMNKMRNVTTEYSALESMLKSGASNADIANQFNKMNSVLEQTQNDLKQTRSEYSLLATTQQRLTLANTIEAWNQKNTAATQQVRQANEQYIASLRDLNTQMTLVEKNNISASFKQTENSMRNMGKLGLALKDQWKQAASSFTMWVSASSAVMKIISETRQALTEIKEVDNILTEISKTSDMTAQQLQNLGQESYNTASKFGRTATDYLTSVQEMSRSGFYGDKGKALAETSLLAQSAGDMTAEVADKWILATNAAYKYEGEAEKINAVLDGVNEVTNRNSVSMTDMAEAMTTVGTSAAQAGVSVEELSSIIGTSVATTKKTGDEVGTAWKAILVNLRNISSDKIKNTLSKANAPMTEIVNGVEQLRDPIEILKDLAKTYNSLDAKDPLKAEITQNVAGKHHANILSAYLSNIGTYNKMLQDYAEGSGSAMDESSKSANNLTGRINALSNSWTAFVNSMVSSDAMKSGVNFLNDLVQGVTKLTSTLGSINITGLGIGLFTGFKNNGLVKVIQDLQTGKQQLSFAEGIKNLFKSKSALSNTDIQALQAYNAELENGTDASVAFSRTLTNASATAQGMATSANGLSVNMERVATTSRLAEIGMKAFSVAANVGIMLAISSVISVITNLTKSEEKMIEDAREVGNSIKSTSTDINDYKDKIESLHKTINDSSSSYEEVTQAREDLMSVQNEMIDKYGTEKESIEAITDAINGQSDAFNKLNTQNYKEAVNAYNNDISWAEKYFKYNGTTRKDELDKKWNEYTVKINGNQSNAKITEILNNTNGVSLDRFWGTYKVTGNVEEVYQTLLKIQDLAKDSGDQNFLNGIAESANDLKTFIDSNKEFHNYGVLYDKVLTNNKDAYDELNKSYEKYSKAVKKGDTEKIENAKENYAKVFEDVTKNIKDKDVINYFKDMYPELESVISTWEFELKFKASEKDLKDDLDKKIKNALGKFGTIEDITNYNEKTASKDQKEAYDFLNNVASDNDLSLKELLDVAEKLNLINTQSEEDLLDKLTNKKSDKYVNPIDKLLSDVNDTSKEKTSENTKIVKDWINSLTDEERKIANSKDFDNALKYRADSLEYSANSAKIYTDALNDVKNAQDNATTTEDISTRMENVQSLLSRISSIKDLMNSTGTGKSVSLKELNTEELSGYREALEYVNGTMQLNEDKVRELIIAKGEEQIAINDTNKALAQSDYIKNAQDIDNLRQKIKDNNYAEGENIDTIQEKIDALMEENETLLTNCDTYDLMNSSIREATGAYQEWLNAQNATESGDMFDDMLSAVKEINNVLNNTESEDFGKSGTKKYKTAVEFIVPDTIDKENEDAVRSYLSSLYNLLQLDENNEVSGLNIGEFCQEAVNQGLMVFDDASQSFQVAGGKTMEDFANGMNLSIDDVRSIFGELQEYGAEFDWGDEAIESTGDAMVKLEEQAQNLQSQLDELNKQKNLGVNVDDSQIKDLNSQLVEVNKQKEELSSKSVENIKIYVENENAINKAQNDVEKYEKEVKNANTTKVKLEAQIKLENAQNNLNQLLAKKDEISKPSTLEIQMATSNLDEQISKTENHLKTLLEKRHTAHVDISSDELEKEISKTQENLSNLKKQRYDIDMCFKDNSDEDTISSLQDVQDFTIDDKTFNVTATLDEARKALDEVNNWTLAPKKLKIETEQNALSVTTGTSKASGTANAGGNWGTNSTQKTLCGELGRELVVISLPPYMVTCKKNFI